jgi:hypothetical protein
MRKIAVFTEGETDMLFVRDMVMKIYDYQVNIECRKLVGDQTRNVDNRHSYANAELTFNMFSVGNDERVLANVKEREEGLWRQGYFCIIALRDMYSQEYTKRMNRIDEATIHAFLRGWQKTVQGMAKPERIKIHCAIMELEAWLLGMLHIFEKFDERLRRDNIIRNLRLDPFQDPERIFFKPANTVQNILAIVGEKKSHKALEVFQRILKNISKEDFIQLAQSPFCQSLTHLYNDIVDLKLNSPPPATIEWE